MIIQNCVQGSPEWLQAKVGVVSMSHAKTLLTKGTGAMRLSYLMQVLSERMTGKITDMPSTWDMERGIALEPYAREAYEMYKGVKVTETGIAFLDESRKIGCSPDGVVYVGEEAGEEGGVEIKCRKPKNHMRFINNASSDKAAMLQCQGAMWIWDAQWWDYVSFCPEFEASQIYIETIDRDEDIIDELSDSAMEAVETIDAMEAALRRKETPAWLSAICKEAIEAVDALSDGDDVEIEI